MTRRPTDPHLRFDEWLMAGARGEPARDLALHASLCAACTARVNALDLLTSVDAGRAPMPPSLAGARRPATTLRRAGSYAAAFAGLMLAATLIGVAGWRLIDLQGLPERVDANASGTPDQAVLGGAGESSQAPSPDASVVEPTEPAGTAGTTQTAGASARPTSPPVNQPVATPRPATPPSSVAASPSPSVAPSASDTPTPSDSPTPTPTGSATPTLSESATPTPTATPTPEPTPTPSP